MSPTFLYMITLSDGLYFGVSKSPRRRFNEHCLADTSIGRAIRLRGRERAELRILVCGKPDYIYALETKAIQAFDSRYPHGYNLAVGGFGGRDPLPTTRGKQAAGQLGRKATAELRLRLSAAHQGKPLSFEHVIALRGRKLSVYGRANISNGLRDSEQAKKHLAHMNAAKRNYPRSFDVRAKIAATLQGHPYFKKGQTYGPAR